jgi:hypothetical protein
MPVLEISQTAGQLGMATQVTRAQVDDALLELATDPLDKSLLAAAVRLSLDLFAQAHPGRSVEVRVPPLRAVQILGGATHRRGTPPAVVEMDPQTWLSLFTKQITWPSAVESGAIIASGERSDLSELLGKMLDPEQP